ncbi:MAG TPA: hypothetical protein VF746_31520 [Longimicrobium sp.]|jgi:hypothetical protein
MTRPDDPYDRYHEDLATDEGMREPPHVHPAPGADDPGSPEAVDEPAGS